MIRNIQEDDILGIASHYLKSNGFYILALGGNQAGFFRFHTEKNRWKAPDLVAFRDPVIAVFEAKIRATQLFRSDKTGKSDYNSILLLMNSENAQAEIMQQARRRLSYLPINVSDRLSIVGGLIAGNGIPDLVNYVKDPRIIFLRVDMLSSQVHVSGHL